MSISPVAHNRPQRSSDASPSNRHSRFLLLVLAAALVFTSRSGDSVVQAQSSACGAAINPVQCENQLPGSPASEWDVLGAGDASIQGFTTDISVDKSASTVE